MKVSSGGRSTCPPLNTPLITIILNTIYIIIKSVSYASIKLYLIPSIKISSVILTL